MSLGFLVVIGWLGILLGMLYVGVPLLMKLRMRMELYVDPDVITRADLPAPVAAFFQPFERSVGGLGFVPMGLCRARQSGQTIYISLFYLEDAGQLASVAMVHNELNATRKRMRRHLQFITKDWGGVELATSNWRDSGVFASDSGHPTVRVLTDDVPLLYRAHLVAEREHVSTNATRWLPEPHALAAFVTDEMKAGMEAQVRAGCMNWKPGDVYTPTWVGAFLMIWRLLPPWRQIRMHRQRRDSRRRLREARVSSLPRPTNVPVTRAAPYRDAFEVVRPGA